MRIDDIKIELEDFYKKWKLNEKILKNNECFSEDRNYFRNCKIYHEINFNDLYNEYNKTFKKYIFDGNKFFILFRIIYWIKYKKIKKELKKFLFYLKMMYD